MIVTLALTVIVPVMVDPDAGDVMVTIRLQSWPDAGGGDVQLPRTTSTAITAANRAEVRVFIASSAPFPFEVAARRVRPPGGEASILDHERGTAGGDGGPSGPLFGYW